MLDSISSYLNNFLKVSLILLIIDISIHIISFYKLFKKEEIKPINAIIPFYNFYLYFKICSIPFILFFIPGINIITLVLMPYKLAKRYGYSSILSWLSVICPFVMVPLICFSNKTSYQLEHTHTFIRSQADIDMLNRKLENEAILDENNLLEFNQEKKTNKEDNLDLISKMESNIINDEYVYDDIKEETEIKDEIDKEEVLEELDEVLNDEEIDYSKVEVIEKIDELSNANMQEKNIEKDIKEIEEDVDTQAVAFGGKEQQLKYSSENKFNASVCPRCHTTLNNSTYCPGCGLSVSEMENYHE